MRPQRLKSTEDSSDLPLMEVFEDRTLCTTIQVTNTNDSGTGSLRSAITLANKHPGKDTITFKIGSGNKTITPLTQLPQITEAVTIDATTQPGHKKKPIIEIDGEKAGGYGLVVRGGHSEVTGLVINRFKTGILLIDGGYDTVAGNYIGTDASGYHAEGNTDKGIIVQSGHNLIGGAGKFGRNVISGNGTNGVQLYSSSSTGNVVASNFIGTDADGAKALPNGSGIGVASAGKNVIGGRGTSQKNIISGNTHDGIVINGTGSSGNAIAGNYIGLAYSGASKLGNGDYGVEISEAGNTVGGATAGQGNVISGNNMSGIALWLSTAHDNVVQGNYIGTDATGRKALGNAWRGIDVTNGASNNTIGGTAKGTGNLISGNVQSGVQQYQGHGNTYAGNTLGFSTLKTALGNGHDGIQFVNATGGTVMNNMIGNNAASGVASLSSSNVKLVKNTLVNDELYGF